MKWRTCNACVGLLRLFGSIINVWIPPEEREKKQIPKHADTDSTCLVLYESTSHRGSTDVRKTFGQHCALCILAAFEMMVLFVDHIMELPRPFLGRNGSSWQGTRSLG